MTGGALSTMNRAKAIKCALLDFHLQKQFKFCIRVAESLYFRSVRCTCLCRYIWQMFFRESCVQFDINYDLLNHPPVAATLLITSVNTNGQTYEMIDLARLSRQ